MNSRLPIGQIYSLKYGYVPYDIFRPVFWGSPTVSFWYQQNTFLYVRSSSRVNETLKNMGHKPILNTAFNELCPPNPVQFETIVLICKINGYLFNQKGYSEKTISRSTQNQRFPHLSQIFLPFITIKGEKCWKCFFRLWRGSPIDLPFPPSGSPPQGSCRPLGIGSRNSRNSQKENFGTLLKSETSEAEAAGTHGLTVAEVEDSNT